MANKKSNPGTYKYYQVIIRKKEHVTPEMLEGIKRAIWKYLDNTPMADMIAKKINKPGYLKFGAVNN